MYQRIYNKKLLSQNGTLIDNWFEEDELKKRTGVSRATPRQNFPKKFFDFENPIKDSNPRDDTFKRVINDEPTCYYKTSNSTYGNFQRPEEKYNYQGDEEKEFEEFLNQKIKTKNLKNIYKEPISLFDTTEINMIVPQKIEGLIGQRLMKTQDMEIIPENRKDKLFQEEYGLNGKSGIINKKEFKNAFENYMIPYYKDKPLTYWAMNQNRANMYHSPSNGINSFCRSSGFTQPIQNTKAAKIFSGNITDNRQSQEIFLEKKDEDFLKKYKDFQIKNNEKISNSIEGCYEKGNLEVCNQYLEQIKSKMQQEIRCKGWTGLRSLKMYLRSVIGYCTNLIEKTDFKFHIYKWGITSLSDKEINLIFKIYGRNCNNTINFIEFLNSLHYDSKERYNLIINLLEIFKNSKDNYIHFSEICKYMNMNYHPEVIKLDKDKSKVEKEFIQSWNYLKEDDIITEENFFEFFEDISTCFASVEDFEQCLNAIKYYKK